MADEILRQQNQPIGLNQSDLDSLPENHPLRQNSNKQDSIKKAPLKPSDVMNIPGVSGHMPPAVAKALKRVQEENGENEENASFGSSTQSRVNVNPVKPNFVVPRNASLELTNLLESLKNQSSLYEEITLPSLGKFYNGEDGPTNGKLHIRPMTGEEEQILATPRFIKKGQALDMIFQRCIEEKTQTQSLLSIDRTFLLIYLRGISYGPAYDVEIKCPECSSKFATSIDLNSIPVDNPPENLSSSADLCGKLPKSNFSFTYRMSLGKDEFEIQDHRERRVKKYGDQAADDTLTYRISQLVESIENVKDKNEILYIIKNLSMQDISYLRGIVTDPGWGLDTKIPMGCPNCLAEFDIDLPLDTSFFFPRRKKEQTQA